MFLPSIFTTPLAGSAVLGQVFDRLGWTACVIGIGLSISLGALLTLRLRMGIPVPDTLSSPRATAI